MTIPRTVFAIVLLTLGTTAWGQRIICQTKYLHDGDLLFQAPQKDNAITLSTAHEKAIAFDHVGIYHISNGMPMVMEANYEGVVDTPFDQFCKGSKQLFVGRVKGADIPRSIENAKRHIGKPYDFVFASSEQNIYCSELVEKSYVDKKGRKLFNTIPMSFHDKTGTILPYWEEFYSRRLMSVPEGEPGTNPMELSTRKCVKIKYQWCEIAK